MTIVNDYGLEVIRKAAEDLGSTAYALRVTHSGGLAPAQYDTIEAAYPSATTEVYTYKLATVTQATITVTYTDSTKTVLSSVTRL